MCANVFIALRSLSLCTALSGSTSNGHRSPSRRCRRVIIIVSALTSIRTKPLRSALRCLIRNNRENGTSSPCQASQPLRPFIPMRVPTAPCEAAVWKIRTLSKLGPGLRSELHTSGRALISAKRRQEAPHSCEVSMHVCTVHALELRRDGRAFRVQRRTRAIAHALRVWLVEGEARQATSCIIQSDDRRCGCKALPGTQDRR
ncbi:hypothetical protein C2E23DRAFT_174746 [Lenzites betulinus]|nr:hypothetical protein C2E23DRAFT_174746 [Lenzites betulinus]